jgi:2-oxoglutarate ferredoxin oxidoreductase subunit alpha
MAARRREPVILFVDHVVAHLREPVDLAPAPASGAGAPGGPDARGVEEEPAPAELYRARDATVLVVAVGIVARAARTAVRLARDQGVRAGLFRPVRLWPFPDAELRDAAARVRRVVVAELNEGQVADHVTARLIEGDGRLAVRSLREPHAGMVEPARILAALAEGA